MKISTDSVEAREEDDAFTQLPNAGRTKNSSLRSRLTLGRSQGYQQVHDTDGLPRPSAWLTKSSTYSLLSNLSNDSCLDDEEKADGRLGIHHVRSESVQNFTSPAPCLIPRSQTAVRFNPFDPCKETAVKRDDTFDATTSDYASEMDEPFIGISNPVYIGFSQFKEESVENHRNFALALNNSLADCSRASDSKKRVLSQLIRLHESTERELDAHDLGTREEMGETTAPLFNEIWSIVTFGGREAGPTAPFDRPLSMWMLRV